jgi:nucleoside-diphosphate kinase
MTSEQTLVFIKPDAVVRRYTGARILKSITQDIDVVHYEVLSPERDFLANKHYSEHKGRFFYDWLVDYVTTAPLHVLILEGDRVIEGIRESLGDTVPNEADPSSLRGRYGIYGGLNTTHASDSPSTAEAEISLWDSILSDDLSEHDRRLNQYITQYIDYPQVDPLRLREITTQYIEGDISEGMARTTLTTLLARESDAPSSVISDLCDVMVANAELER